MIGHCDFNSTPASSELPSNPTSNKPTESKRPSAAMSLPLTRRLLTRSIPLSVGSTSQLTGLRFTPPVASRSFITSPFRSLATPTTSPSQITPGPPRTPNPTDTANRDASSIGSREPEKAVTVDYSKGPSALDKASQLFFFTEILRGTLTADHAVELGLTLHQACGSFLSSSSVSHLDSPRAMTNL